MQMLMLMLHHLLWKPQAGNRLEQTSSASTVYKSIKIAITKKRISTAEVSSNADSFGFIRLSFEISVSFYASILIRWT